MTAANAVSHIASGQVYPLALTQVFVSSAMMTGDTKAGILAVIMNLIQLCVMFCTINRVELTVNFSTAQSAACGRDGLYFIS